MTPFMIAVRELLAGAEIPVPETQPSRPRPIPEATDNQVVIRSLAEQLICEANAVLSDRGDTMSLVDDSGPHEFAFTLGYRHRSARIRTELSGRAGTAELSLSGKPVHETRELGGEAALQALVLSLLADRPDPGSNQE
ncbi:hypothetical protein ACIHDR_24475 [Nocardia sp. NPDC052278]|uniref:hypothetical protein n=1 Tax=unclassified Nocardia TaxID=2637762 RepID=UPI00367A6A22